MGQDDDSTDPEEVSKRLSERIQRFLEETKSRYAETLRREKEKRTFRLGDPVRVKSGPFAAFTGKIEGINQAKQLLKVRVEIFGRETPIKLKFSEADKVYFAADSRGADS